MKYRHSLEINGSEIEILNEALKMYKAHLDRQYVDKKCFGQTADQGFLSYRCKVNNMSLVFEDIRKMPKPVASERGKIPKTEE